MPMPAPLILFVYNRADHTEKCLASVAQCDLASETELFIFSDGPKSERDRAAVGQVRETVRRFMEDAPFLSVTLREADGNRGLANSVIAGVSEVILRDGRAIVLEDDLLCARDFLSFMNDALNFYEKNPAIWSISGFSFPNRCMRALERYPHDVYTTYRGWSWGWATWLDRWQGVDWSVSDYDALCKSKRLQARFSRSGPDLNVMLAEQMAGRVDSWFVRWCYQQNKNDQLTVYPKNTRILNIGLDGSGTHHVMSKSWGDGLAQPMPYRLENLPVDERINRAFCRHLKPPFHVRAINKSLRMLHVPWEIPY